MGNTLTRKEVAKITGIPDRRILFYTEQNILPFFNKDVGRGTAREYSEKDIFFLSVVKELDSVGFSLSRIRVIISVLYMHTINATGDDSLLKKLTGPTIWKNGTLTKEQVVMVISFPQNPEEHALSPDSKNYDDEIFLQFYTGADEITLPVDRTKIVVNLNKVFGKAKI